MIKIKQTGIIECFSAGGGIYIALMPVMIDNVKACLIYDSESYLIDNKNIVEFSVYDPGFNETLTNYFDNGLYIENRKKSPYKKLFSKLVKALKKELKYHNFIVKRKWKKC